MLKRSKRVSGSVIINVWCSRDILNSLVNLESGRNIIVPRPAGSGLGVHSVRQICIWYVRQHDYDTYSSKLVHLFGKKYLNDDLKVEILNEFAIVTAKVGH